MKWILERLPLIGVLTLLAACYAWLVMSGQSYQYSDTNDNDRPVAQSLANGKKIEQTIPGENNAMDPSNVKHALEIADHEAQVRMAQYAFVGVFLGTLGSLMLFGTLLYTRSAANAAAQTLNVAQDTLRLQRLKERPLIDIIDIELDSVSAQHFTSNGEKKYGLVGSFKFTLENKGTLPAKLIRRDSFSAVLGSGLYPRKDFDREFDEAAIDGGGSFIPAGETRREPLNWIFVEALPPDNSVTTIVCIRVLYTDFVSKQRMETEYMFGIFASRGEHPDKDFDNFNGRGITISELEEGQPTSISQVACIKMT